MTPFYVSSLRLFCQRWGGDLKVVTYEGYVSLTQQRWFRAAPASDECGIDWNHKRVYATHTGCDVEAVIHEMGHVFAVPDHPDACGDELRFLGWEVLLARAVGVYRQWSDGNRYYGLGTAGYACQKYEVDCPDWQDATAARKARAVKESIHLGVVLGSICPMTLAPKAVR